jgi:uncharacterized protein involved in exopolysaccharide biosynthesis
MADRALWLAVGVIGGFFLFGVLWLLREEERSRKTKGGSTP